MHNNCIFIIFSVFPDSNVIMQTLNPKSAATGSSVAAQESLPSSSFPGKFANIEMQASSPFIDLPLTSMRKTIAKRMTHSKVAVPRVLSLIKPRWAEPTVVGLCVRVCVCVCTYQSDKTAKS